MTKLYKLVYPPARPAVDVTYKLLIHHGGWRAHVLSKGYIAEEDVAQPLAANTIFLQVRSATLASFICRLPPAHQLLQVLAVAVNSVRQQRLVSKHIAAVAHMALRISRHRAATARAAV